MKIKTIDIRGKEWFDRINGNSYHSAQVTLNFGMKTEKRIAVCFKYGYGDQYIHSAMSKLVKNGFIKDSEPNEAVWIYCQRNNIILRNSIERNCLKRDVVAFGA